MKRLIKKAQHNWQNRTDAIAYINGKIYDGEDHQECVFKYLYENNLDENDINIEDVNERRMEETHINDYALAFAHLVKKPIYDEDGFIEDYEDNGEIYLELSTLQNVTLDEVINTLKKYYPGYPIYNDDSVPGWGDKNSKYKRLAKLKINLC